MKNFMRAAGHIAVMFIRQAIYMNDLMRAFKKGAKT